VEPSSILGIRWRHWNVHRFIYLYCFVYGCSWLPFLQLPPMPFNGILATVSDVFVKNTNPMAAQECSSFHFSGFLGIGYSWLPYLQRHHYVLQRVFRRRSGVLCQITNSMAKKQLSFFHISGLVREWIQLTTLPPPSHLRTSTGVSISVGDSFVKVTNLMSAQDILRQTLLVCMLDN